MKKLLFIFAMSLAATGCAEFDSTGFGSGETGDETSSGSGTDSGFMDDGDESGGEDSSTSTESSGAETGDTSSTDSGTSEETGTTGDEDTGDTGGTGGTGEPAECGNGILEEGEECDGLDFGDETCETQGYTSGTLLCQEDCTIWAWECHDGVCSEQPDTSDFSPCETDGITGETCGDPALYCLALQFPDLSGFCSRECTVHTDCQSEEFAGCGLLENGPICGVPAGQSQGRCVVQCENDGQCPNGMSCNSTPHFNYSICM